MLPFSRDNQYDKFIFAISHPITKSATSNPFGRAGYFGGPAVETQGRKWRQNADNLR